MTYTGVTQRDHVADQLNNVQDLRGQLMVQRAAGTPNSERARYLREDIALSLNLAKLYSHLYIGEQLERVIHALSPAAPSPAAGDRPVPTFTDGAWIVQDQA